MTGGQKASCRPAATHTHSPHRRVPTDRPACSAPCSDHNPASSSGASRSRSGTIAPEVRRARKTVQWTVFSAERAEPRGGRWCPGRDPHPAEGQVGGGPRLDPGGVRREHRATDVVGEYSVTHYATWPTSITMSHKSRKITGRPGLLRPSGQNFI